MCIPARDEGSTVGPVVRAVVQPFLAAGGGTAWSTRCSCSTTARPTTPAEQARRRRRPGGGRRRAAPAARARPWRSPWPHPTATSWPSSTPTWPTSTPAFVTGLLGPLLTTDDVALVKGFYTRPLHGDPTGGGRVTELVARPVIDLLFPELVGVRQPLAGETAAHRWVFEKARLRPRLRRRARPADRRGPALRGRAVAQVDLGVRIHRNRPLYELRPQATDVLRAALERVPPSSLPPASSSA